MASNNTNKKPSLPCSEVREALNLATWIYRFGENCDAGTDLAFDYTQSEADSSVSTRKRKASTLERNEYLDWAVKYFKGDVVKKYISQKNMLGWQSGIQLAAFASKARNRIYVVFRGSEDALDWITDFSVLQVNLDDEDDDGQMSEVHSGFFNALHGTINGNKVSVLEDIFATIQALQAQLKPNAEIVCTGHSLGAALCTLFGYFAAKKFPSAKVRIISFASPRVGNDEFVESFARLESKNLSHHRVVNKTDVVTATPSIDFKHAGKQVIHLTDEAVLTYDDYKYPPITFRSLLFSVSDHYTSSYWKTFNKNPW